MRTPRTLTAPRVISTPLPAAERPPQPCFFVRVPAHAQLPVPTTLERELQRWVILHLSGWLQLSVLERLREGQVRWSTDVVLPFVHALARPRAQAEDPARVLAVRCEDVRGPRRPGLWSALAVAHALAEQLGGEVIDARHSAAIFGPRAWSRPPADGRVHARDHLRVPSSRGPGGRQRLSTLGMAQFGLPDLELDGLSLAAVERGAQLMLGAAQHLIDTSHSPPPDLRQRELLLTVAQLHASLGGVPGSRPLSTGRGWTRVALAPSPELGWPRTLRLAAPCGARTWRSTDTWLRTAWRDLLGSVAGYSSFTLTSVKKVW